MSNLLYGLDDNPRGKNLWLSVLQWFVFSIANIIAVPIVIGSAYGLSVADTAMMTSRTLFVCGMICLFQAWLGHKFAIIEGPAGMWWGVFLILLQLNRDAGGSIGILLRELEWGMMAGSLIYILLAATGLTGRIRKFFTPAVTGVYLVLLAVQLSRTLLEGMLGIGFEGGSRVNPVIALISLVLIVLTIGLMRKGKGIIANIPVLISMLVGWALYAALGLVQPVALPSALIELPAFFPYGAPVFNLGVVFTAAITSVILLSNLIASIQLFAEAANVSASPSTFSRGSMMTGIGTFLAGCFGTAGVVPLTAAASLVSLTGIASRLPFILSSAMIAALGLFPAAGRLLASIPAPATYAVQFAVFGQLLGFGLREIRTLAMDQRDIFVVGFSILAGAGTLFISGSAWSGLPAMFTFIMGNGLIVGVILALILEHAVFRKARG